MRGQKLFFYCGSFPNYGGIQAIVCTTTPRKAQLAARDAYYGTPANVRVATVAELQWHRSFGGEIIYV